MSSPRTPPSPMGRWFPSRRPNPAARLRLFCFSYAGGSASAFSGWNAGLPPDVELCAVQLPGRERRLKEPPIREIPQVLDALEPVMRSLLDMPFILFGYSMGSRLALEMARRLQQRGGPIPRGVVVAAGEAPRYSTREPIHALDEKHFIEELRSYDGTSAEIFQHRELLDLLLPALRADFALVEAPYDGGEPLRCPLSAWGGTEDSHISEKGLLGWREETTCEFRIRHFVGGHFFLRSAQDQVLAALREDLERWMPRDEARDSEDRS